MKPVAIEEISVRPFANFGSDFCLVTAQKPDGSRNTLTAAWGTFGTYWNRPCATVLIRPHRYTREFLDAADTFTLAWVDKQHEDALWFIGRHSGRDMPDKVQQAGLTLDSIEGAPSFAEATLLVQCRKMYVQQLDPACFVLDEIIAERYPEADYSLQFVGWVERAWIAQ